MRSTHIAFAQKTKSVMCKVWFAILMAALVQVGLLNQVQAQAKRATKTTETKSIATLPLDNFLQQVREGNGAFRGAHEGEQGGSLRSNEYKLLTRPTLVGEVTHVDNRAETGSAFLGNIQRADNYSLGVRQLTEFGLAATLSYKLGYANLPQAIPAAVSENPYFTAGPVLELNQSLWRNGFGRETRATKQLLSAQALASKYNNSFAQTQLLSGAEATYWRLALAREAVELSRENLQRAERLRGWSSGRQRSGLGDRSDYLQANSAYLARELELKAAIDEEKSAARAFNTLRGVDSDNVSETLIAFDSDVINQHMRLPVKDDLRDDVRAAEQEMRMAEAQSRIGAEKNRPLVDVFGSVGYNGRERTQSEATRESLTNDHPNYAVGVKLEVPFDLGNMSDAVKGYKAQARAARMVFDHKRFESDRLWHDLTISFQDSLARFKLASEIEKSQREKMEYERIRHGRGRSTTFQVIQFETDYASAQLNRIRTQFDILNKYAELRTFAGGSQ